MNVRLSACALAALVLLGACVAAPSATPLTEEEAVALVLAEDELFTGIGPQDPELIGQASWYEVKQADAGWEIVIRMGWGDCPAGYINEHRWTYRVTADGAVSLVGESGDPVPTGGAVIGTVTAGPTCPVVTDPPDPTCADRPVDGAVLVVTTQEGAEVARVTSDAAGAFALDLAPGAYRLTPQPVEGLMGTAEPEEFTVEWGVPLLEPVVVYDTGIR